QHTEEQREALRACLSSRHCLRSRRASSRRIIASSTNVSLVSYVLSARNRYLAHYYEDLQVANLLKNHRLAKSIADAGWAHFLSILSFKAACDGRSVVTVPPAYTSQTCSGCGVVVAKGLSVRWHACPDCGTSLHRDHNAARNIERLGQSLRGA